MRLPTDDDLAIETIAAAAGAGITVFDTARAYDGNEPLLASALRACGAEAHARVVTKGGMSRTGGAWIPDGRAKTIRADCEASLAALDGLPIDLYLLHAPDSRTPWRTSVRALARLVDEGLVRRIGVANVNRAQLDEALELAPSPPSRSLSAHTTTARSGAASSSAATSAASRSWPTRHSEVLAGPAASTAGTPSPRWQRTPERPRPRSRWLGSSRCRRSSSRSPARDGPRPRVPPPGPRGSRSTRQPGRHSTGHSAPPLALLRDADGTAMW